MNLTEDAGWTELARTWIGGDDAGTSAEAAIRRSVDRQSIQMRLVVVGEVLITAATLAVVWWVLATEREVVRLGWVLGAVLHTAVIWAFVMWNRRGIWGPLSQSTAEYLRLAKERLRRQRQCGDFALGLIGVELLALFLWSINAAAGAGPRLGIALVPPGAVSGIAIWWAVRYRARAIDRLERLTGLERQLLADVQ
ncbi:MAG: hypothetical protein ACKVZ0_05385 [Gemmatimonadales bacterium]